MPTPPAENPCFVEQASCLLLSAPPAENPCFVEQASCLLLKIVQEARSHINVNHCSKSLKNLTTLIEYIVQNTIFVSNC
ncbi:hypothetical protein [Tychonema sp. BBK16]|uniref:hypothetical protein n=1 Tax=Tychonema sp. BBK16 TaxID=2699888 RepID=UPI001F28012C|nr:hypothetical protein [Tychonema sp. BBK16]MCF6373404.1 hypothetical protein [Tychonema sp. BBK16]